MRIVYDSFVTPLGPIALASDGRALLALEFGHVEEHLLPRLRERLVGAELREGADPLGLSSRVRAYFAGALDALRSARSTAAGRRSSAGCGPRSARSRPAARRATPPSPSAWARRARAAPSAAPTG